MKIYIITMREDYMPDPLFLLAYRSETEAGEVCDQLIANHERLRDSGEPEADINRKWYEFLSAAGIPDHLHRGIKADRHVTTVFDVREVELIEQEP